MNIYVVVSIQQWSVKTPYIKPSLKAFVVELKGKKALFVPAYTVEKEFTGRALI